MSTTAETTIAAPRSRRLDPKYTRDGGGRGNFEMLAWLFMRISGVFLVVLIAVHLTTNLLVGDGIHGVRLANAIHLSSWLNREVSLDDFYEDAYLTELNRRIADEGKFEQREN